ncbi:unnamed protein product [Owenia fusiformis]|nr:unnamed protein product [Owenia fusiformis]
MVQRPWSHIESIWKAFNEFQSSNNLPHREELSRAEGETVYPEKPQFGSIVDSAGQVQGSKTNIAELNEKSSYPSFVECKESEFLDKIKTQEDKIKTQEDKIKTLEDTIKTQENKIIKLEKRNAILERLDQSGNNRLEAFGREIHGANQRGHRGDGESNPLKYEHIEHEANCIDAKHGHNIEIQTSHRGLCKTCAWDVQSYDTRVSSKRSSRFYSENDTESFHSVDRRKRDSQTQDAMSNNLSQCSSIDSKNDHFDIAQGTPRTPDNSQEHFENHGEEENNKQTGTSVKAQPDLKPKELIEDNCEISGLDPSCNTDSDIANIGTLSHKIFSGFKRASSLTESAETDISDDDQTFSLPMFTHVWDYILKRKDDELVKIQSENNVKFTKKKSSDQEVFITVNQGLEHRRRGREKGLDDLKKLHDEISPNIVRKTIEIDAEKIQNKNLESIVQSAKNTDVLYHIDGPVIQAIGVKQDATKAIFDIKKILGIKVKTRDEKDMNILQELSDIPTSRKLNQHKTLKFKTDEGIDVSVYQGDITSEDADVIVNAANEKLKHGGGVALAISEAGGPDIQRDCDDIIRRSSKPLTVTDVVFTKVGKESRLKCKYILHAIGPRWKNYRDKSNCERHLVETFYNSFSKASLEIKAISIAIPAISSGIFGVPQDICVRSMYVALMEFSKKEGRSTTMKDIRFVNILEDMTTAVVTEFRRFREDKDYSPETLTDMLQYTGSEVTSPNGPYSKVKNYCNQCDDGTLGIIQMSCGHWYCSACKKYFANDYAVKQCLKCINAPTLDRQSSDIEKCIICHGTICKREELNCGHAFCGECITKWMKSKPQCPVCGCFFGKIKGNQPKRGTMKTSTDQQKRIPGYEGCGVITINYSIPSGNQGECHPNPGRSYAGTNRKAYLPDNKEGNEILDLLKEAFDARLIFTIGQSSTNNREGITWNDIHHKTRIDGGPENYGYPDLGYLSRVREELAAKGITTRKKRCHRREDHRYKVTNV